MSLKKLFGGQQAPAPRYPDPAPAPAERSSSETAGLAERQRQRFSKGGGRAMTFLSGGETSRDGSGVARFLGGSART